MPVLGLLIFVYILLLPHNQTQSVLKVGFTILYSESVSVPGIYFGHLAGTCVILVVCFPNTVFNRKKKGTFLAKGCSSI
jgi:hypothetical protein